MSLHQKNLNRGSLLLGTSLPLAPTLLICPAWETLLVAVLPPTGTHKRLHNGIIDMNMKLAYGYIMNYLQIVNEILFVSHQLQQFCTG